MLHDIHLSPLFTGPSGRDDSRFPVPAPRHDGRTDGVPWRHANNVLTRGSELCQVQPHQLCCSQEITSPTGWLVNCTGSQAGI